MTDWEDRAACHGLPRADADDFFAHPSEQDKIGRALAVCKTCPVKGACLRDALAWPASMDHWIRGGLTEEQRAEMRRDGQMVDLTPGHPGHGTVRGYLFETRHGGETCQSCRDANARYYRALRQTQRAGR